MIPARLCPRLSCIPRVHIFDDPVTGMDKIWGGLYSLAGILESRYTAVREGRARLTDFHDIWVFVDEGNHLGGKLKTYWTKNLGETSASPSIWAEAIAPLLQQGRQANMFGEFMFQDLTDRAMGGSSPEPRFLGRPALRDLTSQSHLPGRLGLRLPNVLRDRVRY